MRIMEKLAYKAIKLATLACVGGFIAGTGTLLFAAKNLNNYNAIKDDLITQYIESAEFEQDYLNLQENLQSQHKHGIISTSDAIQKISNFTSAEEIEKALMQSNSLIGESYRRATNDYEKERKSLLTKSLVGLSCTIPAFAGCAVLDKINEKSSKNEEKSNNQELIK